MKTKTFIYLFCFIFFLFAQKSTAQEKTHPKIDSLKKLLDTPNLSDNRKITLLIAMSSAQGRLVKPLASIPFAEQALELAKKLNDKKLLARAYREYGEALRWISLYDMSNKALSEAIKLAEISNDTMILVYAHARIAENYNETQNFPTNVQYARKAKDLAILSKNDTLKAQAYETFAQTIGWYGWNLARQYDSLHVEKKLRQVWDTSYWRRCDGIYLARKTMQMSVLAAACNNMGMGHDTDNNTDSAFYYYKQTQIIGEKTGMISHQITALSNIGSLYKKLKKYQEAEKYEKEAIAFAEKFGNKFFIEMTWNELAAIYSFAGRTQEALDIMWKVRQIIYDRLTEKQQDALASQEIGFQTEKKEAQLKLQEAQLQTQRTVTLSTSAGLGIAAILGFVFFRLNEKNKALAKANAVLVREQNHRIKNNLQVVSSLLSLQSNRIKDEKAKVAIEESQLRVQSMAFIHRRLYGENLTSIDFSEYANELVSHVVGSYGYKKDKLDLQMNIAPTFLDVEKAIPLGLVLNELVSNACKYAFSEHPNPVLAISFQEKDEKHWELLVKDNGSGLPADFEAEKSNSFGMKLVRLQAKQLEGKVSFENEGGLKVSLVFGK